MLRSRKTPRAAVGHSSAVNAAAWREEGPARPSPFKHTIAQTYKSGLLLSNEAYARGWHRKGTISSSLIHPTPPFSPLALRHAAGACVALQNHHTGCAPHLYHRLDFRPYLADTLSRGPGRRRGRPSSFAKWQRKEHAIGPARRRMPAGRCTSLSESFSFSFTSQALAAWAAAAPKRRKSFVIIEFLASVSLGQLSSFRDSEIDLKMTRKSILYICLQRQDYLEIGRIDG